MKRLLWLLGLLALAACQTRPAPPPTRPANSGLTLLQIGVTSSATAVVPLLQAAYGQQNPQVELQFVVANSTALYDDLSSGLLDAVLLHHIPQGNGRYFNPIALDGVVFMVHPDNPVQTLSSAEIQAIFNGRITNWQTVGGANEEIELLSREQGSGLRALLRQQIMAEQRITPNALLQVGDEAMHTAVANNPAALGYSSLSSASQTSSVKIISLDGRWPTLQTTADQTYALTTPLYFIAATEAEPVGELRALLAWLQSEEGQGAIGEVYGRIR